MLTQGFSKILWKHYIFTRKFCRLTRKGLNHIHDGHFDKNKMLLNKENIMQEESRIFSLR